MAQVNLPMTLGSAYWDKQKAALAKAPKAPATKLPDEMKALTKLHLGMDWDVFSADKLDSAEGAKDRASEMDGAKGKVKALTDQAKAVETVATKFESEAKKDKAIVKEVLTAVAAIIKAAKDYAAEVDEFVADARKTLATKTAALASQKPKSVAPAAAGPAAVDPKTLKLVKSRLLTAIGIVRKPKPGPARPMRYIIVQGKTSAGFMLGLAVGPAQVKLLQSMMPKEGPYKIFKYKESSVIWEKNALTVVCDSLGGGILKKVQAWLKKTFKLNVKMRLRNSAGVVAEETEGEDLSEDMLKVDASEALSDADLAQEYQERLAGMAAAIKKAMAHPSGNKIKALMGTSAVSAKGKKYDAAMSDLDEIEALLDEGGFADPVDTADEATPGTPATATESAEDRKLALADAMTDWKARRAAAVTSLKAVAGKIAGAKHASSTKAILEIQAVIKNLTAEPATLQQVTDLRKWLGTDDVVNDVCELAEDVRTPLMVPLERMHGLLTATA